MSENLQTLLRDSLLNNSYDYSSMHMALRRTWENSYSYLYTLQKNYVGYEELHRFSGDEISRDVTLIGDLYVNRFLEACFDIDYDFIHVCNREEFYHSRFHFANFTFQDMLDNPSIFLKIPIILIDDQVIWDYKIQLNTDTFTITLPFKRNYVISLMRNPLNDNLIYLDHKVQVLVVDNVFYTRIKTNKMNLNIDRAACSIAINDELIGHNKDPKKDRDGIYAVSIHVPNSAGQNYELGSMLYPATYNAQERRIYIQIDQELCNTLSRYVYDLYVSVIYIRDLHQYERYDSSTRIVIRDNGQSPLFLLQHTNRDLYAMPIPVEDLIVYKTSRATGKTTIVKNIDTVELYYPNIYKIKDVSMQAGDRYTIYYFYHPAYSLEYQPAFEYFYEYLDIHYDGLPMEQVLDDIDAGVADDQYLDAMQMRNLQRTLQKIMTYQYYNHRYGEIDFVKRFIYEDGKTDYTEVEYKDETLRDWIAVNPWVLRDYVIEQNKLYGSIYHFWTNTTNLAQRYRTNTYPEMGEFGFELDEPCYVFAFRNEDTTSGKMLDARLFVDGLYVVNNHQTRYLYSDLFYIPVEYVTEDSYLEIEIFPSYQYEDALKFKTMDDVKTVSLFTPEDGVYPTIQDIFFIDPGGYMCTPTLTNIIEETNSKQGDTIKVLDPEPGEMTVGGRVYKETHIYSNDFFEVTEKYKDGNFVVETTDESKPVRFTRLSQFEIRPKSNIVLDKDIGVCITKVPNGIECMVQRDGFPYIALVENRFKFHLEYIRVFRNGRLMPRTKYIFQSTFSYPRIMFTDWFYAGDIIYIDITPYRYKEIYHQLELEEGQTLIDLSGIITKPFDIRYYDVYMNGRKLGLNNVFTISPWEITLVNLKSFNHLQIFEKERDYEWFGTNYQEATYYYTIDDLFKESFVNEDEKNEIIKRMIDADKDEHLTIRPNEDSEEVLDFSDLRRFAWVPLFYWHELLPKTYVNPDRVQFDEVILEEDYPLVYDTYKVQPWDHYRTEAERQRRTEYTKVVALEPDTYVPGGDKNADHYQYVFCVGHPDDVEQEYLDEEIVINNTPKLNPLPYDEENTEGG